MQSPFPPPERRAASQRRLRLLSINAAFLHGGDGLLPQGEALAQWERRPRHSRAAASYNSVRPASNWRAMVRRWISAVPSGMRMTRAKR